MIIYNNKQFRTKSLDLPEFGEVLISVMSLNDQLFNPSHDYMSDEARCIDEKVFYFVQDSQIDFPADCLICLLINEIQ